MKFPRATVGIIVRNSATTIKGCIDSVLSSDYPNFEVLVVDAFSHDGTWEILKRYGKKIHTMQKAGNIPAARNEIIRCAKSEMIAFTDSDCTVDKKWLMLLISALNKKEIVASGGYCATAQNSNYLQRLIGIELEDRFRHFPKFVSRLPFMSLCVRTSVAKKNLLDEKLGAAEDADFGYRLTEKGKMIYVPEAKVWHNHRASLVGFFRQQFNYGKFAPLMYKKFSGKVGGDHISKPTMMVQPPLFLLGAFSVLMSGFSQLSVTFAELWFALLAAIYIYDAVRLTKNPINILAYVFIFALRTFAWVLGLVFGIKNFLVRK